MNKTEWEQTWQEQHQQAFNVAGAIPAHQAAEIRKKATAALQNGDGFAEFRRRLSKIFWL